MQIRIGDATITRIEEMFDTSFSPNGFLVGHDPEEFARHLHWLMPNHVEPSTGNLVFSMHSWLVRTPRHTVLVDTCIGNDKDRLPRQHWHQLKNPYLDKLRAAGVAPEEVDYVMCTHLHPDHVGWNTRLDNGRWVPTFPKAKYVMGRIEFEAWKGAKNVAPIRARAFADSVLPVVEAGRATFVEDGHVIEDGFTVELAPGHSSGNAVLRLASGGRQGLFVGDVLHSPIQVLHPDWSSVACEDPLLSAASRRRVLESCCEHRALMLPAHFGAPYASYIVEEKGAFGLEWLKLHA
ncbi:MAG: MBL fold metallo-hydrolase [Alphaproteobacteria bacterium]|nr:MBL fold metallo-hydrolase [Alphaproteobacteria bacterium]